MTRQFTNPGRAPRTLLVLGLVWTGLLVLWLRFDAAPWIMGVLFAVTLPAAWDYLTGRDAGMCLGHEAISWHSGRRRGEVHTDEIDHVRLDTRLDFSVRTILVLHSGRRIRLPQECTPRHKALEAALVDHGLRVERHHFSLL